MSDISGEEIFKKRLPLENEEFKNKYWNKNNYVFIPVDKILKRKENVYFRIYKDNTLIKNTLINSIIFKRGDLFLELESGEKVKIPMNMILVDFYAHYNLDNMSALFKGSDKWKVSDDSEVPDYEYMITSFTDDKLNPLFNPEIPREDEEVITEGLKIRSSMHGCSLIFGSDEEYDDEEDSDAIYEHSDDKFPEKWEQFFSILKEKNDAEDIILISVYKHENNEELNAKRDLLFSGQLQEMNVNDDDAIFEIIVDDTTIEILNPLTEIDVYIPEDSIYLFGIIPCTVRIKGTTTNALVSFSSISKDEDSTEDDFEENDYYEEDFDNDNIEAWKSLYENIDIMFKIREPVMFSIHNPDTKKAFLVQELTGIRYENETGIFTVESGDSFSFNMEETILSINRDLRSGMFSALFKAFFIVDDNNTEKEFDVFITNEK